MFYTKKRIEIIVLVILGVVSFIAALNHMKHYHGPQYFYQNEFAPAVMATCGHGFKNIGVKESSPLAKFLKLKSSSFDCKQLPVQLKILPLNLYQASEKYLMLTAAKIWQWRGISWRHLYVLNAFLYMLSIIAFYGLMRFAVSMPLALLAVFWLSANGLFMRFLPQLRDFSIAPFILIYLVALGWLVKTEFKARNVLSLSVFTGVVLGIGLGFRLDLLVYIPLFIITLILFSSTQLTKQLPLKLAVSVVYLITVYVSAYPILSTIHQGNALSHVALLGFTDNHNIWLSIKNSPVYHWIYLYNDSFIFTILASYNYFIKHLPYLSYASHQYSVVGQQYYLQIMRHFPADILIRISASIYQILTLAYDKTIYQLSSYNLLFGTMFKAICLLPVLFGLYFIQRKHKRDALFIIFLVLFLGAYPYIEFEPRHYFYLIFVSMWFAVLSSQIIFKGLMQRSVMNTIEKESKRFCVYLVSIFAVFFGVIYGANAYQKHHLIDFFKHYQDAARSPAKIAMKTSDGYSTTYSLEKFTKGSPAQRDVEFGYLVLTFNSALCHHKEMVVKFDYEPSPLGARTHTFELPLQGKTQLFFPVYNTSDSKFIGFKIPNYESKCFVKAEKVNDVSSLPLQLVLKLPQNWSQLPLHQTIGLAKRLVNFPELYRIAPEGTKLPADIWKKQPTSLSLLKRAKILTPTSSGFIVDGEAKIRFDLIAKYAPTNITKNDLAKADYYYIIEGQRKTGGLTVGLIANKGWVSGTLINIINGIDFKVAIKILNPGRYQLAFGNHLQSSLINRFDVTKLGLVRIPKRS